MSTTPWSRLGPAEDDDPPPLPAGGSIAIIGAGSSGLVAAKHLRDAGYEVEVYEKSDSIGGAFLHKAYDEARLVSSKYLTSFSDLRPKPSDPPHISLPAYVEYLAAYAEQEDLRPLITFGAHIASVRRAKGAPGYTLCIERAGAASLTRHVDAVCVCSGLHESPYLPSLPGLDTFSGECFHSATYKDRAVFAGKRVLVIGCGETGMDLGYRAVQVASTCAMSIKRGFLSVPHEGWGGVPLDTLIANLFEHSYEHWWCHRHHFKWAVTTLFIRVGFWLTTGSSVGYNQYVGQVEHVKRGYNILCKSTAALPYLNRPTKQVCDLPPSPTLSLCACIGR